MLASTETMKKGETRLGPSRRNFECSLEVADAAADVSADAFGILVRDLQAAVGERFVRGGDGVVCERAHFTRLFLLYVAERVEVFDFAGKAHGKVTGIELRDRASATPARHQPCPRRRDRVAERRDQTKTRDDDSMFH